MKKIPGQWEVIRVPVIEYLIVILNVVFVHVNRKFVNHATTQQGNHVKTHEEADME